MSIGSTGWGLGLDLNFPPRAKMLAETAKARTNNTIIVFMILIIWYSDNCGFKFGASPPQVLPTQWFRSHFLFDIYVIPALIS